MQLVPPCLSYAFVLHLERCVSFKSATSALRFSNQVNFLVMGVATLLKFWFHGFFGVVLFFRVTHDYQMVESVIINLKITRLDFSAESQLLIAEEFQTLKIHPHLD